MTFAPLGGVLEATASLEPEALRRFEEALAHCAASRVVERIWQGDHTLWKPAPEGIANRLGWLRSPSTLPAQVRGIESFVAGVRADGITDVLLLGMGGSSLAPELFASTFPPAPGHPRLAVLDSTDPGAVLDAERRLDPARTLFLVSTKSGGTIETLSLFRYFHGLACERLGRERAGRHFAAITDPGSALEETARGIGAREVFLAPPDIGGRFSALTLFGLVPAALCGVELPRLIDRAEAMAMRCASREVAANPGAALGALAGTMAAAGCDKLTLVCSPAIRGFGGWAEQLVAESTGKEGRGIVPVVGEVPGPCGVYGHDRFFVFLLLDGDAAGEDAAAGLAAAGLPVLRLGLRDAYDLGGEFFRWELATALAGHLLGVNPFDQPDVESAKVQAGRALAAYRERGALPREEILLRGEGLALSGAVAGAGVLEALRGFLDGGRSGDYVALQAYLPPRPGIEPALGGIQCVVRDRWHLACTTGFGPRFLHSTGQLHKGGANNGLFIQLTADDPVDAAIPDRFGARAGAVSFGVLKEAQTLGDAGALRAAGRRVLRVHLGHDAVAGLRTVLRLLGGC